MGFFYFTLHSVADMGLTLQEARLFKSVTPGTPRPDSPKKVR